MPAVIWQQPNRAPAGNVRVLHVTAEVYPQVKTGGLGDIAAALPTALLSQGVDARLLVPGYPAIIDNLEAFEICQLLFTQVNGRYIITRLFTLALAPVLHM